MGSADRAHAGFGHAEVLHLALRDQLPDRARHVFDRDVGVDPMLIIEIHDVGPEPFQRTLDALPDALGATVLHLLPVLVFDAELGRDHHLPAQWRERLPDEAPLGLACKDRAPTPIERRPREVVRVDHGEGERFHQPAVRLGCGHWGERNERLGWTWSTGQELDAGAVAVDRGAVEATDARVKPEDSLAVARV